MVKLEEKLLEGNVLVEDIRKQRSIPYLEALKDGVTVNRTLSIKDIIIH